MISPMDPTEPWTRDNAGHPLLLAGKYITWLPESDLWRREVPAEAKRTVEFVTSGGRPIKIVDVTKTTLSTEVYMALLCRFHAPGTVVLSTWDLCGVVQAAAVRLDHHCMTYLGMGTRTALSSIATDEMPLLGVQTVGTGTTLQRVLGDHRGAVKTEAAAGATGTDDGLDQCGGVMQPVVRNDDGASSGHAVPGRFYAPSRPGAARATAVPRSGETKDTAVQQVNRAVKGAGTAVNVPPTPPRGAVVGAISGRNQGVKRRSNDTSGGKRQRSDGKKDALK